MMGNLFPCLAVVETRLGTKGFGRRDSGGVSFPNDRFLWWRSFFRGFLLELVQNGVVYIIGGSRSPMGRHQH